MATQTDSLSFVEQRKYIRLKTVFPVEFRVQHPEASDFSMTFYQAFTNDISQEGMCITFKDHTGKLTGVFARKTKMMVFVNLPFKKHPSEAIAEIAWVRSEKKPNPFHIEYKIGLKYLSINKVYQTEILRYARKLQRKPYIIGAYTAVLLGMVAWLGMNVSKYQEKAVGLMEGIRTLETEKKATEKNLERALAEKAEIEKTLHEYQSRMDGLSTKLNSMEGQQASSKYLAYAGEQARLDLKQEIEEVKREKNSVVALLDNLKADKEILETKLAYYKNYQPVPEGILTKIKTPPAPPMVKPSSLPPAPKKEKTPLLAMNIPPAGAPAPVPTAPTPPVVEQTAPKFLPLMPQRPVVIDPKKLYKLEHSRTLTNRILAQHLVPADQVATTSTAKPGTGCYFGAFLGPGEIEDPQISVFQRITGRKLSQIVIFQDWSSPFPQYQCNTIIKNGAIPHITWEPWYWGNENKIKLTDIILGKWDGYISKWAISLAAYKHPVFIRFAHEYNGNWYPWATVRNGKNPEVYIKAWRHVHNIFKKYGANNAQWVWCMNHVSVPNEQWNNPDKCYPGDKYVDWIGIDGYNWGLGESWSTWRTFHALFMPRYSTLVKKFNKPIMIAEFASAEHGGKKDDWMQRFEYNLQHKFPNIKAVCWFNQAKEKNWLLWSSIEAMKAARKTFSSGYFRSSAEELVKEAKKTK